jgi:predicted RNase H-like HicB family nuclease
VAGAVGSRRELGRTYTVRLDPGEGAYTVTVPALPGVVTQGGSVPQCLERVKEAIALHIAAIAEDGEPIPEEHQTPNLLTVTVAASDARGRP